MDASDGECCVLSAICCWAICQSCCWCDRQRGWWCWWWWCWLVLVLVLVLCRLDESSCLVLVEFTCSLIVSQMNEFLFWHLQTPHFLQADLFLLSPIYSCAKWRWLGLVVWLCRVEPLNDGHLKGAMLPTDALARSSSSKLTGILFFLIAFHFFLFFLLQTNCRLLCRRFFGCCSCSSQHTCR